MFLFLTAKGGSSAICNADCFQHFSLRLFDYARVPRKDVCPDTPKVTEQAMYALACERILSHLPEHRKYSPYGKFVVYIIMITVNDILVWTSYKFWPT